MFDFIEKYNEYRESLDIKLLDLLIRKKFTPIPISNNLIIKIDKDNDSLSSFDNFIQLIKPKAIILSGGNDIGDFKKRDEIELKLLSWSEKKNVPVLGICRGMQMMGKFTGSKLMKVNGHVGTKNKLIFKRMKNDFPKTVSSFHNYAFMDCPKNFNLIAYTNDGVIKAIMHKKFPG